MASYMVLRNNNESNLQEVGWSPESLATSFSSEADCVSYAKKFAQKVHASLHFDLEYVCRKGVPPEPYNPNRGPSFQTETLLLNEDGKLTIGYLSRPSLQFD